METPLDLRINKLKERGYNLSIKKVFNDGFESWKKIIFFGIFSMLFAYLFNSLISAFFSNLFQTNALDENFRSTFMKMNSSAPDINKMVSLFQDYIRNPQIIKKTILSSFVGLLMYPMSAGVVYCAYQADKNGIASFKDLINGFQGNKFIRLVGLVFIYTLIVVISLFLLGIPALYFIPAFILAGAFIIIDDVPLTKAIKASFQIVNMNFFPILTILVGSFLISKVLGILMCGIGVIITIPFSMAIVYSIYKNTIGTIEIENNNEGIGEN